VEIPVRRRDKFRISRAIDVGHLASIAHPAKGLPVNGFSSRRFGDRRIRPAEHRRHSRRSGRGGLIRCGADDRASRARDRGGTARLRRAGA
jgi:hypothetical protein